MGYVQMDDSILIEPLATEEEKEHIDRIRASVCPTFLQERGYSTETHPDLLGDVRILRYIRGLGVKGAEEGYNKLLQDRAGLGLDELRDHAVEVITKKGPMGWDVEDMKYGVELRPYIPEHRLNCGVHASGAPISYADFSVCRLDEFVDDYGQDAFFIALKSMLELRNLQLSALSTEKYHRLVGVSNFRSDMAFLGRNKYAFLFLRSERCRELHTHYQEIHSVNYFLDSHWLFSTVYNGIKGFLPERTQKKNLFLASSEPVLGDQLPPSVLRVARKMGDKPKADDIAVTPDALEQNQENQENMNIMQSENEKQVA